MQTATASQVEALRLLIAESKAAKACQGHWEDCLECHGPDDLPLAEAWDRLCPVGRRLLGSWIAAEEALHPVLA